MSYRGKVSVHAFGKLSYDAKAPATVPATMYDIASLTKVVATTTLVAKLAEGDFSVPLDLDAKVERYLPEWGGGPNAEWRQRASFSEGTGAQTSTEKRSGFSYEHFTHHVLAEPVLFNFANSALACFSTGTPISASLHNSRKSRYAAPALTVSP